MPESTNLPADKLDIEAPEDTSLEDNPVWEQQEGESSLWYGRFYQFLLLGPSRSILEAFNAEKARKSKKKQDSPSSSYSAAAKEWMWKERAEAWDAEQRKVELERYEAEREALWDGRGQQFQERSYNIAEKCLQRVEGMLAFPLSKQTVTKHYEDGRAHTTVVEPVDWSYFSMTRLMDCANKTVRLALDMEKLRLLRNLRNTPDEQLISETADFIDRVAETPAPEAG